jgi:DNA-binding MarR family transcriptional regulator
MDPKDLRTLKILEQVGSNKTSSQRDMAGELNISLGLVNSFIKRLVKKGYLKITSIPKNRISYILTPRGAAEKTRLTYLYIQHSYKFYKEARQKLRDLYNDLENQSLTRIVFYGAGDLAEIAYISLQETGIQLVAIVDDVKMGTRFMQFVVTDPVQLETVAYDRILVTTINSRSAILDRIRQSGISLERVLEIS